MPFDEELLDTQVDDESEVEQEVNEQDQEGDDGNSDDTGDDQPREKIRKPFLEVDERTKYMTADDAKRGFSEAGKRIAQLSAWEKELKEYGDLNPTDVRAYLDELIESRQTAADLKRQLDEFKQERERSTQNQSNQPTKVANEAKLTREEKDAVDWLKEQLPSLGYISKEDALKLVKDLQDKTGKIDRIEQMVNQQQEQFRSQIVNQGRVSVKAWMAADEFKDDEDGSLQQLIEENIKGWINQSDRRIAEFYKGGTATENLLKEAYEKTKKALMGLRTASVSTSGSNYAKSKADALKRNVKKLPNQDLPQKRDKNLGKPKKRIDSSGKRDWIGEKHNEAFELMQRVINRNEEQ